MTSYRDCHSPRESLRKDRLPRPLAGALGGQTIEKANQQANAVITGVSIR